MTDIPTPEGGLFLKHDMLELPVAGVIAHITPGRHLLTIEECDFTVRQAQDLLDWLNKVVPQRGVHDVEEFYRDE